MRREEAEDRARRESPAEHQKRLASRSAYVHSSREEAIAAAEEHHGDVVKGSGWRPFRPREGERIIGYNGAFEALVDKGHGAGKTRVESLLPLRAQKPGQDPAPVDLTLQDEGSRWVPANPLLDVRFDKRLGGGTQIPGAMTVAPVGPDDAVATLVDGKPFWANIATDTDYFVRPEPMGAEAFWQLRSEDSPEELRLHLDLPEGLKASVNPNPRSLGEVQIKHGDEVVGTVSPSFTVDADQQPVPTKTRLEGDTLVVSVDHRGRDLAYPLLVDPTMHVSTAETWPQPGLWAYNPTGGNRDSTDFYGWNWYTANGIAGYDGSYIWSPFFYFAFPDWSHRGNQCIFDSGCDGGWGRGLYNIGSNGVYVGAGDHAEWIFWAANAGQVNLDRAELYSSYQFNGCLSADPCTVFSMKGLANYGGWVSEWDRKSSYGGGDGNYVVFCTPSACDQPTNGQYANAVVFQLYTTDDGYPADTVNYLRGAYMEMTDDWAPTDIAASHTNLPSGWTKSAQPTANASANDTGIGMRTLEVVRGDGTSIASGSQTCDGTRKQWCPASWATGLTYSTANVPEGIQSLQIRATDVWFNSATGATWQIKVDRSGPVITPTGSIVDTNSLGDNRANLHLDVSDGSGSGATARSGVQKVDTKLDGAVVDTHTPDCTNVPDNCRPDPYDVQIDGADLSQGKHTVTVEATDRVGNTTTSDPIDFEVKHADTTEIGPGEVNLLTGEFTLTANDASFPAWGSSIGVTRTYSSRNPTQNVDPAFGPGWTSSLPVPEAGDEYAKLIESPTSATLVRSDGLKLGFKNSKGSYISPAGYQDLALTKTTTFKLTDHDGNGVTFGQPVAGSDGTTTYTPTLVDQPGGSGQTAVTYEIVNSVARPKQIVAPPASGVSCSSSPLATRGCRTLRLFYASTTTATGMDLGQWGDYKDRLSRVALYAWDPSTSAMVTDTVAQYMYDSTGLLRRVSDPRSGLKTFYDYDGNAHLTAVTPQGQQGWTLTYATIPSDPTNTGRLKSVSRAALPGMATTTVGYQVPLKGAGTPYQMGQSDVSAWGQTDIPAAATAIFPPDHVPGDSPTAGDYGFADIHYLDLSGREVNLAAPGGRISTTEYDANDDAIRALTPANRERALGSGNSAQRAAELDTQRTFNLSATQMLDEYGPQHTIQLASGESVQARAHTHVVYDEGNPGGDVQDLPTTTTVAATISGRPDADTRVTKQTYNWTLGVPTTETKDAGGLNLTSTTVYDPVGLVTETRQPANPAGGDAHATKTIYYTALSNPSDSACGNKPEWANLPCKTLPVVQPSGGGLPPIPVRTYTYTRLGDIATQTDVSGSKTRTQTFGYDAAGRSTSQAIASDEGTSEPTVQTVYDPATGLPTTTSTSEGTITRSYDSLGRITSYTDADNNTSTTSYDLRGRPTTTNDGKGSQTRSYDATTGDLTQLSDSAAGTFTATYDADGNMVSEAYPNGLTAQATLNEAGERTKLQYTKSSNCGPDCSWYVDQVVPSIHGQWLAETSTFGHQDYLYDGAGRLTQVKDNRNTLGCTVRDYHYDADSNRTSNVKHDPAVGGACDPGSPGTPTTHSYDAADRLNDSGYLYDSFGRISSVPGQDTQTGVGNMTQTYFADDRVQSITQNGVSATYTLDPARRIGTEDVGGAQPVTRTNHYDDDSDSPAWNSEDAISAHWIRNVAGIDGDLAAIQDSVTGVQFQLANLHGDVVATAAADSTVPKLLNDNHYDEFGVRSIDTIPDRYGWLGSKHRATSVPSGAILMGQRLYEPQLGRFLQPDPVPGGSANTYDYVNQDPIAGLDLCGTFDLSCIVRCGYRYCGGPRGYFRVQQCVATSHGLASAAACFIKYCHPIFAFVGCVAGCATKGGPPKLPRRVRRKYRVRRICFFGHCVPEFYLLPFVS